MEFFIVSLFFGLIFAVICAMIANAKNRNELPWFFAGFFFGIVAFGAACFASKRPFRLNKAESKRCQHCQSMIDIYATHCSYCTQQVAALEPEAVAVTA